MNQIWVSLHGGDVSLDKYCACHWCLRVSGIFILKRWQQSDWPCLASWGRNGSHLFPAVEALSAPLCTARQRGDWPVLCLAASAQPFLGVQMIVMLCLCSWVWSFCLEPQRRPCRHTWSKKQHVQTLQVLLMVKTDNEGFQSTAFILYF